MRGGISKSSKGINLSEDIFAGYNNVVCGGQVAFKEYLQVDKGRDVGMSQIYMFEAKLSQGATEQSLSWDVYQVAQRLAFFCLLSLYYRGIGKQKQTQSLETLLRLPTSMTNWSMVFFIISLLDCHVLASYLVRTAHVTGINYANN